MSIYKALNCFAIFVGILLLVSCKTKAKNSLEAPISVGSAGTLPDVDQYITTADQSFKFKLTSDNITAIDSAILNNIIIDAHTEYQEMDGFGFAVTGGSAQHINSMGAEARKNLLNELFGTSSNQLGISFIRVSIGASDLDEKVFSYNDLQNGQSDINQNNFSIAHDLVNLVPVLKEIIAINPNIKIMASPWSPPAWMKTNNSPKGGSLRSIYYDSYANYLVKYIQEMGKKGIVITHLTIQNEPLHDGNNPSMYMEANAQADFVKNSLGPIFKSNNINTKVLAYDHNADRIDYPLAVMDDANAKQYLAGSAFHLYGGSISALSTLRNAHPDKEIYFTEQWYGAPGNFPEDLKWHTREVIIGATRNWSRNVIEWNLTSNPSLKPYTEGGCSQCLGAITIDGDTVVRNAGYYVIAHAAKYVRPGSKRIASNTSDNTPNVAFETTDQKIVLIVLNNSDTIQDFNVSQAALKFSTKLNPGSVSTFVWNKE